MQIEITPEYLTEQGFSLTFPKRFWAKVDKVSSPNGCWLWTACLNNKGYGFPGMGSRMAGHILAHRASWILCRGPIPEGMEICHTCPNGDNPKCVNPKHLRVDTHKGNFLDMSQKGRSPFGEKSGHNKVTWEQVCYIRNSKKTLREIADEFGIDFSNVSKIRLFKTWNHPLLLARVSS